MTPAVALNSGTGGHSMISPEAYIELIQADWRDHARGIFAPQLHDDPVLVGWLASPFTNSIVINLDFYKPRISVPVSWLSAVQYRIDSAAVADCDMGATSGERISNAVAGLAKRFFMQAADLLPTEPHLYATATGDLVAEFEPATGHLTVIVSEKKVVLFSVVNKDPESPRSVIIKYDDQDIRARLKEICGGLTESENGTVVASA